MAKTAANKTVEVEVESSISDGLVELNITKIWGSLDLLHRGSKMTGGMTWEPAGRLPVKVKVNSEVLTPEEVSELFVDLIDTLMPSIKVFIKAVNDRGDAVEESEDF